MAPINLFITGLTGYVGGTTIARLLQDPANKTKFHLRALVRSEAKAKDVVEPFGATPVLGSLDDTDLLTEESAKADVVLHFADADHIPAIQAITKGLQTQVHSRRLARPVLIHTSGTGVLLDGARGAFASDEIYSDGDVAKILALPDNAIHRDVELVVLDPKLHESVDTYIVSPPTIWGRGTGFGNQHSIQIPFQVKNAIRQRKAYRVGKGLNRWSKIHVEDLADLYNALLLKAIGQPNQLPKGRAGYYHAENGEFSYGHVSEIIADELYKQGATEENKVHDTPDDKEQELWLPISYLLLGGNSRSRSVLASKHLGWTPKHDRDGKEFDEYIREEVRRQLREAGAAIEA